MEGYLASGWREAQNNTILASLGQHRTDDCTYFEIMAKWFGICWSIVTVLSMKMMSNRRNLIQIEIFRKL
jgi:hypothetical protein